MNPLIATTMTTPPLIPMYLQWCSSEEQPVGSVVELVEDLGQLAVVVFHAVTLVNDHVLPADL